MPAQKPDLYPLTIPCPSPCILPLCLNKGKFKLRGKFKHHRINTHSILCLKSHTSERTNDFFPQRELLLANTGQFTGFRSSEADCKWKSLNQTRNGNCLQESQLFKLSVISPCTFFLNSCLRNKNVKPWFLSLKSKKITLKFKALKSYIALFG